MTLVLGGCCQVGYGRGANPSRLHVWAYSHVHVGAELFQDLGLLLYSCFLTTG